MKKSDLIEENGLGIILRNDVGNGDVELYKGHLLDYRERNMISLNDYNEDLTHNEDKHLDIVKIEDVSGELIWERKEIDWSKVPFGTRVRVWDEYDTYVEGEGLFLEYVENDINYPFRAYVKDNDFNYWSNCELVEEPKEEVMYKEVLNEFNNYCEEFYKKNESCADCKYQNDGYCFKSKFIDDRFTITRK